MSNERKIQCVCGNLRRILNAYVDFSQYRNGDFKLKIKMKEYPLCYVYHFTKYQVTSTFSKELTRWVLTYLTNKLLCDMC